MNGKQILNSLFILLISISILLIYGLQVRDQSAVRGREIIEWEGRQGRRNES